MIDDDGDGEVLFDPDDVGGFPLDPIAARGETAVRVARTIVELGKNDADLRDELMRLLRALRSSFKTFPASAEITEVPKTRSKD